MDENADLIDSSDSVESLMVLEEAPAELVLEVWEPTGDPQVDSALEDLRALDSAELGEHCAVVSPISATLLVPDSWHCAGLMPSSRDAVWPAHASTLVS
jgi:hypothetical protein